MKTNILRRYLLLTIASLITAAVLTACGGGGGSSSGSGNLAAGKASIAGNVNSAIAFNHTSPSSERLFAALLALAVTDAQAAGIGGVTVDLLKDGTVIASQLTNERGDFQFTGLAPGSYTIELSQGGQNIGTSPAIQLDSNTRTKLNLNLSGGINSVEIEAEEDSISGEVEDGVSSDDQKSEDDVSKDDDSTDDISEDKDKDDGDKKDDKDDDDQPSKDD
jgi:hypothetical protein